MVRDLMIDIKERDFVFSDKSNSSIPVFDVVWGNLFEADETIDALICNIIIPEAYWSVIKYTDNEFTCKFVSKYVPNENTFRIRLVSIKKGVYGLFSNMRGQFGLPVSSYALSKNVSSPLTACMLPFIDIDGEFIVRMVKNSHLEELDKAYVYSSKESDIFVDYSDNQAAQILSLCAPGNHYRYPILGIGITNYLNSVVTHTDLPEVIEAQFLADKKPIQEASFDSETGDLTTNFSPENEEADKNLESVENLNSNFFRLFTDEYIRKNTVLNELTDLDFINMLGDYTNFIDILFFRDSNTTTLRIADKVENGRFDAYGNIIEDNEYLIVTSTLEANTIIMFDDENEDDIKDAPVFIINDTDETRLYISLIEQPYWITEECHKCFILLKRSVVRYMIRKTQFTNGNGLYIVPQTSNNVKNMLGFVQDVHTGRLLGIVSNSTNISDITLEEITQHIYATKVND